MSSHHHHYSKEEGHSGCEERVEILQAEVEKKNRMLLEVKKHLREAAEREKQLKTISHDSQVGIMCVYVCRGGGQLLNDGGRCGSCMMSLSSDYLCSHLTVETVD